jgi:N-acetylglucosaminyldiphosphoundecaprenol N-acetyl-beta-D-mannosaminyltransferase
MTAGSRTRAVPSNVTPLPTALTAGFDKAAAPGTTAAAETAAVLDATAALDKATAPMSMLTGVGTVVRRQLFGLPFDAVVLEQAVERCMRAVAHGPAIEVGVLNAAKIVTMRSNRALADAVSSADLLLADGQSVVWASRFLRQPLPGRVAGIDLFTGLLAAAEREDRSVYLIGATPQVLARTVAEIRSRHPRLHIAGSRDGYFTDDEAAEVAADVKASGADLLFLGMTSPKKELFCARYGEATGAKVTHGVGGSFDVLAGMVRRAPRVWQVAGMEWLYRVLQEPRRLGPRYLRTNTRFVRLTLAERWRPTPVAAYSAGAGGGE